MTTQRVTYFEAPQNKIAERLKLLAADPSHPALKTHQLKGSLAKAWLCSVEYD